MQHEALHPSQEIPSLSEQSGQFDPGPRDELPRGVEEERSIRIDSAGQAMTFSRPSHQSQAYQREEVSIEDGEMRKAARLSKSVEAKPRSEDQRVSQVILNVPRESLLLPKEVEEEQHSAARPKQVSVYHSLACSHTLFFHERLLEPNSLISSV